MRKTCDELTFTDDFMFCAVLQRDPELCRKMTELILNRPIQKILRLQGQQEVEITPDGRGVRFDVYFEDDKEQIYDIEMQPIGCAEVSRRSRYYQGMIDLDQMERGAKYAELKDSYVIFIMLNNLFPDLGLHRYTFESICKEKPGRILDDGVHKVFFCARGTVNDISSGAKNFLSYLTDNIPKDTFTNDVENMVQRLRESKTWRKQYMTFREKLDDALDEGKHLGIEIGKAEGLKIGKTEGRKEEQANTERERRRADAAEARVKELEEQLEALQP